jgi:CheY-like chemotaxis protein
MIVMNGPTATCELRKLGFDSPIIGVTGNVMHSDVEYYKKKGADLVLAKPLNFDLLLQTLSDFKCTSLGDHSLH